MSKYICNIFIIISFLFFLDSKTIAQQILWRSDCHLSSDDFNGKKPRKSRWDAVTVTQLHYTLRADCKDSIAVKVTCMFDTKKSWKKYKKLNPYLLKHEQTHFDIAELYARKLRQDLKKYLLTKDNHFNPEWKLQYILLRNNHGNRHTQKKYDRQTRHSGRRIKQREWNTKIADELKAMSNFEVN